MFFLMDAKLKPAIFLFSFKSGFKCVKLVKNVKNSDIVCLSTSFSEKNIQIASILTTI